MPSDKKLRSKLKEMQKEHEVLLNRVQKSNTKMQERGQRLRSLESDMADLERALASRMTHDLVDPAKQDPKPMQRACLLFNPKAACIANGSTSLDALIGLLRAHGIEADVTIKTSGKVIIKRARKAAKDGEDLVIVAGGDGTIEKAAAELVGSKTTLAILPIGTMNNLARSLGVPLDLNDACALIGMGVARDIDVGQVNVEAKKQVRYFLETAGLGLGAIALPLGQEVKKGVLQGLPDAIKRIVSFKPTPISVELDDGQVIPADANVVTVSNAPLTGMNFLMAPEAKMDDGWLDVAIFNDMGKTDLIGYLMSAHNGTIVDNPKIKKYKARRIKIRSLEPQPRVSDKDKLSDEASLDISVIPQALRVIVGKGIGLSFPVEVAASTPPHKGAQETNGHTPEVEVLANGAAQKTDAQQEQAPA